MAYRVGYDDNLLKPPVPRPEMPPAATNNGVGKLIDPTTGLGTRVGVGKEPTAPTMGKLPTSPKDGTVGKVNEPAQPKPTDSSELAGVGRMGIEFKPWETIDSSISEDQWRAWEGMRDHNCPANAPYRGERTTEDGQPVQGCLEKPVDCPHGMTALDVSGRNLCVPLDHPRVTAAWAGAPGAAPYVPGVQKPPMPGQKPGVPGAPGTPTDLIKNNATPLGTGKDPADAIWKAIEARLNGGTRYTPEVMAAFNAQNKMTAEGQAQNQLQQADEDMAARGVLRSSNQNAARRDIRGQSQAQVLQGQNEIAKAKIDADYADKSEAIKQGQEWLNSLRDHIIRTESNAIQRELGLANIELAYKRLEQEAELQKQQMANDLQKLSIANTFSAQQQKNAFDEQWRLWLANRGATIQDRTLGF